MPPGGSERVAGSVCLGEGWRAEVGRVLDEVEPQSRGCVPGGPGAGREGHWTPHLLGVTLTFWARVRHSQSTHFPNGETEAGRKSDAGHGARSKSEPRPSPPGVCGFSPTSVAPAMPPPHGSVLWVSEQRLREGRPLSEDHTARPRPRPALPRPSSPGSGGHRQTGLPGASDFSCLLMAA